MANHEVNGGGKGTNAGGGKSRQPGHEGKAVGRTFIGPGSEGATS